MRWFLHFSSLQITTACNAKIWLFKTPICRPLVISVAFLIGKGAWVKGSCSMSTLRSRTPRGQGGECLGSTFLLVWGRPGRCNCATTNRCISRQLPHRGSQSALTTFINYLTYDMIPAWGNLSYRLDITQWPSMKCEMVKSPIAMSHELSSQDRISGLHFDI